MLNVANTFVMTVLTLFTFYRCYFKQNDVYMEHSLQFSVWACCFIVAVLVVIFTANQVTNEVSERSTIAIKFMRVICSDVVVGKKYLPNCARNHKWMS